MRKDQKGFGIYLMLSKGLLFAAALFAAGAWHGSSAAQRASTKGYVPTDIWKHPETAAHYQRWFGNQLRAMREPVLSAPNSRGSFTRRFRMLVLPSFHPAYAIRIDQSRDGTAMVRAVRLNGRGGYAPGVIAAEETYRISRQEIEPMLSRLSVLAGLPPEFGPRVTADGWVTVCSDGIQVVFELVERGRSAFVTRHSCDMTAEIEALITAVSRLARRVQTGLDGER